MTTPLTDIEQARADFLRAAIIEARLCAEAERRAERAMALVRGPRLRPGPDHTHKMTGSSSLVHRRRPLP